MTKLLDVANLSLETLHYKFWPVHEGESSPPHGKPSFGFWGARNIKIFTSSRKGEDSWFSWNDLAFRLIKETNTADEHYMVVKKRLQDLHDEFEELKANLSYSSRLTLFFREQILSYFVPSWDTYGLVKRLSEELLPENS